MGYTHEELSQFIPPALVAKTAGAWTPSAAASVIKETRGAAASAFTLLIPVHPPVSGNYRQGSKLKSIDVFYSISTADAADFATVELEKVSLPAAAAAPSGAVVAVGLDPAHDTAAKRRAQGDHVLSVALSVPVWIDDGEAYFLQLVVDAAAATVFTLYGARVHFTFRA